MNVIEITDSSDRHIGILKDLLHQQMIDIGSEKTGEVIESAIKNALKQGSRARFLLARLNSEAVGMVFLNVCSGIESEGDYVWLNEIQIKKEYRKQGIGRKLLDYVVNWAKANNYKCILGVTDPENKASQHLFRSGGFGVSDIRWLNLEL